MKTCMTITLLLFNTILFLTKCNIMIDAQLLHPLDLVIGQWGVKLHRKDVRLLESILFPPMLCSSLSSSKQDEGLQNSNSNRRNNYYNNNGNTLLKRRKRLLNCNLVLNGDGKFILHPPSDLCTSKYNGKIFNIERQPLKGRWKVKSNPYCVTDRQYDELILISNPKIRYRETNDDDKDHYEEIVTLEMNCKVRGRFGSNTIRSLLNYPRGRDAGRLTHGVISIRKDRMERNCFTNKANFFGNNDVVQNSRRAICATFNAKACPNK